MAAHPFSPGASIQDMPINGPWTPVAAHGQAQKDVNMEQPRGWGTLPDELIFQGILAAATLTLAPAPSLDTPSFAQRTEKHVQRALSPLRVLKHAWTTVRRLVHECQKEVRERLYRTVNQLATVAVAAWDMFARRGHVREEGNPAIAKDKTSLATHFGDARIFTSLEIAPKPLQIRAKRPTFCSEGVHGRSFTASERLLPVKGALECVFCVGGSVAGTTLPLSLKDLFVGENNVSEFPYKIIPSLPQPTAGVGKATTSPHPPFRM